jgi:hypothetical protein
MYALARYGYSDHRNLELGEYSSSETCGSFWSDNSCRSLGIGKTGIRSAPREAYARSLTAPSNRGNPRPGLKNPTLSSLSELRTIWQSKHRLRPGARIRITSNTRYSWPSRKRGITGCNSPVRIHYRRRHKGLRQTDGPSDRGRIPHGLSPPRDLRNRCGLS